MLLALAVGFGAALGLWRVHISRNPRLFARWYERRARRAGGGEIGQRRGWLMAQAPDACST